VDSDNDFSPNHFCNMALCSGPAWGLVGLVPRRAGGRPGSSQIIQIVGLVLMSYKSRWFQLWCNREADSISMCVC